MNKRLNPPAERRLYHSIELSYQTPFRFSSCLDTLVKPESSRKGALLRWLVIEFPPARSLEPNLREERDQRNVKWARQLCKASGNMPNLEFLSIRYQSLQIEEWAGIERAIL